MLAVTIILKIHNESFYIIHREFVVEVGVCVEVKFMGHCDYGTNLEVVVKTTPNTWSRLEPCHGPR